MKGKVILRFTLAGFLLLSIWGGCASGPKKEFTYEVVDTRPKLRQNIPSDISSEIREQIERLYSSDAAIRGAAASKLGEMGAKAAPAIPFLIDILNDNQYFLVARLSTAGPAPTEVYHSPGGRAELALTKITGQNFGKDRKKWQEWWEKNK